MIIPNPKSHVMHIPAKDLSLLLCRIDRQGDLPFRFKISLTVCECKAVILFRFSPESSQKRRRFLNQEEKCDFLITLTTLLGSCHSYHIHTISPISLTIFSLSRRLRTTAGQSPNIHTKLMGSWRGHRNHRSLLCLDWTHSLRTSCTLQNPILELGPNSSSGRGGRMWCGIL